MKKGMKGKKTKTRIVAFVVLIFFLINICLIIIPSLLTRAESGDITTYVSVTLDGKQISFDALPYISGQRTMVPIRMIMEAMNASVNWYDADKTIEITAQDGTEMKLQVGNTEALLNGKSVRLDVGAQLRYSRTFVPLRFISENMGLTVGWDGATKTVILKNKKATEDIRLNNIEIRGNRAVFSFSDSDIKYSKMLLTSPRRLVIDVQNCVNAVNSYNLNDDTYISAFRYSQFTKDPNCVRFVMELKTEEEYLISQSGNTLTVSFIQSGQNNGEETDTKPQVSSGGKPIIVIDPGHGGSEPGACGYDENGNIILKEKDPNLTISLRLYELLKNAGYDTYMTRSYDTNVSLVGRAEMANSLNADLFVSIHNNANDNKNTSGTMVMYAYNEPKKDMKISGKQMAEVIQKHLVNALPGTKDYGAIKNSALAVLHRTNMPAVIVEGLFVSNENDLKLLMDEAVLNKMASAVFDGIKETIGLLGK